MWNIPLNFVPYFTKIQINAEKKQNNGRNCGTKCNEISLQLLFGFVERFNRVENATQVKANLKNVSMTIRSLNSVSAPRQQARRQATVFHSTAEQNAILHFNRDKQFKITTGSPVRVWLSTLYNRNAYTFELTAPGTVTKISDYEYVVTHGTKGLYPITLSVRSKDGSISLVSNTITLNLY